MPNLKTIKTIEKCTDSLPLKKTERSINSTCDNVLQLGLIIRSLVLYVCFVNRCFSFCTFSFYAPISNVRQVPLLLVEQDTQTGNLNTNVRNVLGQWMNIILALRNGIV
jgi:hypothetical protein